MRRFSSVLAPLILAVAAMGSAGCRKTPVDTPVHWHYDMDAAEASAKAQHKPLFVYFGASWDTAAKELEHRTFTDPEIRFLLARHFVAIHVDASDDDEPRLRELATRFKVVGDPTIVLVAADGKTEMARFNEFVPPRPLARILTAATKEDPVRSTQREMTLYRKAMDDRWAEAVRKGQVAPPGPPADSIPPAPVATITLQPLP